WRGGGAWGGALEGFVNRLRGPEDLAGARDDPPLGVQAGVSHQRDERVENLRHAAAEGRRREVQDTLALDLSREPPYLLHQAARRDRPVIEQGLVADVDELEHRTDGDGYWKALRIDASRSGISRNGAAILPTPARRSRPRRRRPE